MRATASGRGVGRDEGEGRVSVVRGMRSGSSHLHRGVVRAHPGRYPGREHPLCRRRRHRDAPTDPAPAGRPTLPRQLGEFRMSTRRARLATGGARREPPVRRTPSSCPRGPHNAARATASTPSLKPGATVARPPRSSAVRERDRRRSARAREVPCRNRCWAPPSRVMGTPPRWRRCAR